MISHLTVDASRITTHRYPQRKWKTEHFLLCWSIWNVKENTFFDKGLLEISQQRPFDIAMYIVIDRLSGLTPTVSKRSMFTYDKFASTLGWGYPFNKWFKISVIFLGKRKLFALKVLQFLWRTCSRWSERVNSQSLWFYDAYFAHLLVEGINYCWPRTKGSSST